MNSPEKSSHHKLSAHYAEEVVDKMLEDMGVQHAFGVSEGAIA
ncbi:MULTISPECIES: hypothetical protein [Fischerella]|nr:MULTISPECIES: hypothetical protein [Fischerella]